MSSRQRGVFKAAKRAAAELNKKVTKGGFTRDEDDDCFRVAVLLCIPYVSTAVLSLETALQFTPYPEADLRRYIAELKRSQVVQGPMLDVTEWDRPYGMLSFWLDAYAAGKGAMRGKVACPHCGARCTRDGRTKARKQRWRCVSCRRSTVFPGSSATERLRVAPTKQREAERLARKGYSVRAIADKVGVAKATAEKLRRLALAGEKLGLYRDDLLFGPEAPPGYAKLRSSRHVAEDPKRRRLYEAVEAP